MPSQMTGVPALWDKQPLCQAHNLRGPAPQLPHPYTVSAVPGYRSRRARWNWTVCHYSWTLERPIPSQLVHTQVLPASRHAEDAFCSVAGMWQFKDQLSWLPELFREPKLFMEINACLPSLSKWRSMELTSWGWTSSPAWASHSWTAVELPFFRSVWEQRWPQLFSALGYISAFTH